MALSEHATSTQAAVIGTEHALNSPTPETSDGVFQLFVDTAAMVAGDILEIRVKEKVIAGGTQRQVFVATLSGVRSDPAWASPSLILLHGWDMTIKQTAGTGRSYPWSIRKVA